MSFSELSGLFAGITALIAYAFYFRQIVQNQSTPNPASWAIWVLTGLVNAGTYFSVTNGNLTQSLIVIAVLLSTILIFTYSLVNGKFTNISTIEIVIFVIAVSIGIFWHITADSSASNLLLQGIYLLSYIPTILGIVRGSGKENPTSWIIVLIAYVFSTLSVIYGPHRDWVAFANPLVNGLLGTGLVVFFILYKQSEKRARTR